MCKVAAVQADVAALAAALRPPAATTGEEEEAGGDAVLGAATRLLEYIDSISSSGGGGGEAAPVGAPPGAVAAGGTPALLLLALLQWHAAMLRGVGARERAAAVSSPAATPAAAAAAVVGRHLPSTLLVGADGLLSPPLAASLAAGLAHAEPRVRMAALDAWEAGLVTVVVRAPPAAEALVAPALAVMEGDVAWQALEVAALQVRALFLALAGSGLAGPAAGEAAAVLARTGGATLARGVPALTRPGCSQYSREAAVHVVAALLPAIAAARGVGGVEAEWKALASGALDAVVTALDDAHPQVRAAAGLAVRTALTAAPAAVARALPRLVPRMCLLRYYGYERQRYLAADIWKAFVVANAPHVGVAPAAALFAATPAVPDAASPPIHASPPPALESPPRFTGGGRSGGGGGGGGPLDRLDVMPGRALGTAAGGRSASPLRSSSAAAALTEALSLPPAACASPISAARMPSPSALPPSPAAAAAAASATSPTPAPIFPTGLAGGSTAGPLLVARYIDAVVAYYLAQLAMPEAAAGEAAANCIAELATKIAPDAVAPHVGSLLDASLAAAATAAAWQTRDAAVVAGCRLVLAFPDAAPVTAASDRCIATWLGALRDAAATVREHAAMVVAVTAPVLPSMPPAALEALRVATSPAAPAADGAPAPINADTIDGALCLMRELAPSHPTPVFEALVRVVDLVAARDAPPSLQESFCRALPPILTALGKTAAKRVMDGVLPLLCASVASREPEARTRAWAAGDCIAALRKMVGPSIFAGRLTPDQAAILAASDCIPRLPPGGGASDGPRF